MCEVMTAVAAAEKESLQAPRRLHSDKLHRHSRVRSEGLRRSIELGDARCTSYAVLVVWAIIRVAPTYLQAPKKQGSPVAGAYEMSHV